MFVFTRDPFSPGFNSSLHILLGLKLGEEEETSAIVTKFYEGITPGILTCKLKTGIGRVGAHTLHIWVLHPLRPGQAG